MNYKKFLYDIPNDFGNYKSSSNQISKDLFTEGLNLVSKSNNEIYSIIGENTIDGFDIERVISTIFDKYHANMKNIYDIAVKSISSTTNRFFVIFKYKKIIFSQKEDINMNEIISSMPGRFKANFAYYRYTNFTADIPPKSIDNKIIEIFLDLYEKIDRIALKSDMINIADELKNISFYTKRNVDKGVSIYRGSIIHNGYPIYEDQFDTELFKYFHNGMIDPYGSIVPKSDLKSLYVICERYKDFLKQESDKINYYLSDYTKNKVVDTCANIENLITDKEYSYMVNTIFKQYCVYLMNILDACMLAYAYRMETLKNAIDDSAQILSSIIYTNIGGRLQ